MQAGDVPLAFGALLLFLTNLVSIILAGSLVFVGVGFSPFAHLKEHAKEIRLAIGTVVAGAALIAIPLAFTGQAVIAEATAKTVTQQEVREWLGEGTEFEVVTIEVKGRNIEVILTGPGDPPEVSTLGRAMGEELDDPFNLNVRWIPEENAGYRHAGDKLLD